MQKIKIEKLPEAVKDKVISKEEAAKIIWEDIYTRPHQYGLSYFSEDQKSDLLLGIHKKFENLFDKFVPGSVPFKSYLIGFIAKYKAHFLRLQAINCLEKKCISTYLIANEEVESQKYSVEAEYESDFPETEQNRTLTDITEQKGLTQEEKNKKIADLTTLVLLMKACKDIDDDSIKSVSSFTGVDKSLLYNKIEELKSSMERKSELYQLRIKRRNNSYFFHRKYLQAMISPIYKENGRQSLRERYEKQTKKWHKYNTNLSVHSNTPSNEEIARVLGIKPRMVSFYINHVRKDKIRDRIKNMMKKEDESGENTEAGKKEEKEFIDEES
ncbi:hypothetical protein DYE50_04100 [Treponema ruminis]|uniref:Uncharacterized protein n=1 Tax=Treponema ruminis TaxID=744515 RepID=A0A7W8G7W0_9SPIR|nr:hypothetical protein [Treponema ruminis]MBB5225372.1 hypothetical protein [Treponema ruminis]QSI01757.1 hypothetical protein DYE50_04100 [Treponema ruminis]